MELARQHLGGFASRVYPPARLGVPNKERYVAVHVRQTDNLNAVTSEDLLFPHQYYVDPGTFRTLAAEVAKQHGVSVVYVETDNAALLKRLDKGFMALEVRLLPCTPHGAPTTYIVRRFLWRMY